jgi:hypothetical protein
VKSELAKEMYGQEGSKRIVGSSIKQLNELDDNYEKNNY